MERDITIAINHQKVAAFAKGVSRALPPKRLCLLSRKEGEEKNEEGLRSIGARRKGFAENRDERASGGERVIFPATAAA